MLQVNRLLCPVLASDAPSTALQQAVHLTAAHGATLSVVPLDGDRAGAEAAIEAEKQSQQETIPVDVRELPAIEDETAFAQALQGMVEEVGVDLVVVDSAPGQGDVPPLAVERARCLVEQLDCPLFLVQEGGAPPTIQRLLVPTDLSSQSTETLKHATELASCYGASIVLLHVIDTSPYVALTPVDRLSLGQDTLSEHRARRHLRHAVKEGQLADVPIRIRVEFGDPVSQITQIAEAEDIDMMVLSARGRELRSKPPLGSVATHVLRRVSTSLFLTRPGTSLLSREAEMNVSESTGEGG